jgi:glycosyltransferase involved in cell wall biosynthesis
MKVCVMPADSAGCGYYRLIWSAEYLQGMGYDVEIQYPKNGKKEDAKNGGKPTGLEVHFRGDVQDDPNAEIIDVKIPDGADVLVMQRLSHNWHARVIEIIRSKGVAVIIDMDDDLSCIHPDNKAFLNYHPKNYRTPFSWRNVEQACKAATLVTVSTKALLGVYARHGRGHVVDNYVPERYLHVKAEQDKVFGWPGTTDSHPNDLQVTGGMVQTLIDEGYDFRVIGPISRAKDALRLTKQPTHTGIVQMVNWAAEIARLQAVLAPLAPTQFNTGKSRLKAIEAAAVGVPWVGSPRAEYRRFNQESGSGLLADNRKEWYRCVKQLMDDAQLRQDLGEKGRQYMQGQTIEKNAWRLWEAWERAHDIQRGVKS